MEVPLPISLELRPFQPNSICPNEFLNRAGYSFLHIKRMVEEWRARVILPQIGCVYISGS
jgi:hypothetical protein